MNMRDFIPPPKKPVPASKIFTFGASCLCSFMSARSGRRKYVESKRGLRFEMQGECENGNGKAFTSIWETRWDHITHAVVFAAQTLWKMICIYNNN